MKKINNKKKNVLHPIEEKSINKIQKATILCMFVEIQHYHQFFQFNKLWFLYYVLKQSETKYKIHLKSKR